MTTVSNILNLKTDEKAFKNWVAIKQSDPNIKAFKMHRLTYHYLIGQEMCYCEIISMEWIREHGIEFYLTSVPIFIDDSIEPYVIEAEEYD